MTLYLGLMAVGLVVCVVVGLIAFYASERPPGWEGAQRPGFITAITPKYIVRQQQQEEELQS
jgi:hypothetical protein